MPSSQDIRARLDHPIIDADGHVLEYLPAVEPHLREALGSAAYERYRDQSSPLHRIMDADNDRRLATRTPQSAWWGTPARNTRDLATAAAPKLMYDRMDELGLDFAVLYPTKGFGIAGIADDELRVGVCRGFNEFYAGDLRALRRPHDGGRRRARCTRPTRRSPACSTAPTSASRSSASPRASPARSPSPRPAHPS